MATRSHKLAGTAGHVISYLKDDEVARDYYANDDGELTFSTTWGKLATEFGIEQGLSREQFARLFHGQDPQTGEQLASGGYRMTHDDTGEVVAEAVRTPMIDVVYSTPKSVSEYLVTASPDMRAAVAEKALAAARAAFEAMESSGKLARVPIKTPVGARNTKQQGSSTERQTASLVAVPVVQFCARPTEETVERGAPPDPSLHVHVPIFTLCKADNGRYYTADEYGIKNRRNVELRDSVFMGELARGLEELGIEIDYADFDVARTGRISWEVKGSNPELRRFWSSNGKRAWAIRQEFEEKHGRPITDAELTRALYVTRLGKTKADKAQDSAPVWERWAQDAHTHGHKLRALEYHQPIEHDAWESLRILSNRLESANGLCRENAVFRASEIRPAIARCAVGLGFTPAELNGYTATLTDPDNPWGLVPLLSEEKEQLWTTRAVIAAELRIAQAASDKARVVTKPLDELIVARSIKTASVKLDEEQIAAVREMCAGKGWVNFIGPAGTGKTVTCKAVVEAHKAQAKRLADKRAYEHRVAVAAHRQGRPNDGRPTTAEIVVVSMVAKTAGDTGRKIGADRWGSVESILRQVESGKFKPTKNTLIFVEEAGQMDTLRMDKLRKAIGPARVIALGDPSQLTPIGAGGWWDDNLSKHGSVTLTMVRRQKDPQDVADYNLIREGKAPEALRNMEARGRVHISEDSSHRVADVLMDYAVHRNAGWRADNIRIIADTSNEDIDTCNRFAQRFRLERGEVGAAAFEVHDESQDRRWTLRENDHVTFLRAHFVKGQTPVKNGTEGVLLSIDEHGRARVRIPDHDGGWRVVNLRLSAHEQHQVLGLNYASHANRIQGGEVPIVLCMPGNGQTSANSGYSMVTRSTHETHVYLDRETHSVDPLNVLGKAWSEREVKQSALSKLAEIRRDEMTKRLTHEQDVSKEAAIPNTSVDLYELPPLEPVPEMDDVKLNRLEDELGSTIDWSTFEMPDFETDWDRDEGPDFGLGLGG